MKVNTADPVKTFGKIAERFQVLFADGSVRFLPRGIDKDLLRNIMTYEGREIVDSSDLDE